MQKKGDKKKAIKKGDKKKMFKNLITHTLKGINGRTKLDISTIDVSKVLDANYHERLFCIFDRQHKYSLTIKYDEKYIEKPIWIPVFMPSKSHVGFAIPIDNSKDFQEIEKRYKTAQECQDEIDEIEFKKEQLEKYVTRLRQKIEGGN